MKYCPDCKISIDDAKQNCPRCGSLLPTAGDMPQEDVRCNPNPEGAPSVTAPKPKMKWYKFLIYFLLFADAVLYVIYGVYLLTGKLIDAGVTDVASNVLPPVPGFNIFMGIVNIVFAILAIVTRFRLAGFKKRGPELLYAMHIFTLAICVINIGCCMLSNADFALALSIIDENAFSIVAEVVVFIIDLSYFGKRKAMFHK